jgi:hypothetical protein
MPKTFYEPSSEQEAYSELSYYTLAHTDPAFIHQHIVDAFIAQTANEHSKPIGVAFALIGLYLYLEKNLTGRQVQRAHMELANRRKTWPKFDLPEQRGAVRVGDVVAADPGIPRDTMIRTWCASVWEAWSDSRNQVLALIPNDLSIK